MHRAHVQVLGTSTTTNPSWVRSFPEPADGCPLALLPRLLGSPIILATEHWRCAKWSKRSPQSIADRFPFPFFTLRVESPADVPPKFVFFARRSRVEKNEGGVESTRRLERDKRKCPGLLVQGRPRLLVTSEPPLHPITLTVPSGYFNNRERDVGSRGG